LLLFSERERTALFKETVLRVVEEENQSNFCEDLTPRKVFKGKTSGQE